MKWKIWGSYVNMNGNLGVMWNVAFSQIGKVICDRILFLKKCIPVSFWNPPEEHEATFCMGWSNGAQVQDSRIVVEEGVRDFCELLLTCFSVLMLVPLICQIQVLHLDILTYFQICRFITILSIALASKDLKGIHVLGWIRGRPLPCFASLYQLSAAGTDASQGTLAQRL